MNGLRVGLRIERSGFEPRPGSLVMIGTGDKMLRVTCDGLASHPGRVAPYYRNRNKLRQCGPVCPECGYTFTLLCSLKTIAATTQFKISFKLSPSRSEWVTAWPRRKSAALVSSSTSNKRYVVVEGCAAYWVFLLSGAAFFRGRRQFLLSCAAFIRGGAFCSHVRRLFRSGAYLWAAPQSYNPVRG